MTEQPRRHRRSWRRTAAIAVGSLTLLGAQLWMAGPAASASASSGVRPNGLGTLDCNGYSTIQAAAARKLLCTDIRGFSSGYNTDDGRFYDNGHYIGHDEPSLRFLSTQPGSGTDVTFTQRLGVDPTGAPTVAHPGTDTTHFFELSPAPWYGMTICDSESEPQLPCTPESDSNAPKGNYPGAGAAFLELQFYPPGFAPFIDSISCDNTHWCAALNIDSLECTANGNCNNECIEPVNFSFIETNGVPPGPPSPQLSDLATFTPDAHTLLMNPGDQIRTRLFDAAIGKGQHALEAKIDDLSTGQSGHIVASGANGFMHTSMVDCSGTPFNFEPMFNTARPQNSDTWSVLLSGILSEYEIGHFTACTSVNTPTSISLGSFRDQFFNNCLGPYEATAPPDGGNNPEASDAFCYRKGDTHNGTVAPNEVTGCIDNAFQNGDLDFDGSPYWADWPDSTTPDAFPSPLLQQQPVSVAGAAYPDLQFETDVPASEFTTCVPSNLAGCAAPPPNAPGAFYPYWTQATVGGQCVWEFGQMNNGNNFGKDKQYAHLVPHGFLVDQFDLASSVRTNPTC